MDILAVNCGSSSLKMRLIETGACQASVLATASVEDIGPRAAVTVHPSQQDAVHREQPVADWSAAFATLLSHLRETGYERVDALGHRVVQGGQYVRPVVVDDSVIAAIDAARRIAPLHNGPSLEGIRAAAEHLPGVPAVAVFDTEFHAGMPAVAAQYAIPTDLARDAGLRRYGYHGLAHRSLSERFAELAGTPHDEARIVTLQLGNGCSAAAVRGRGSIDTSMGFTPLEGLVMGSRSGDIDPAAVVYLQRERGMTADAVDALLNHDSGLLGFSGLTGDMADLLDAEARGDERASAAIELFCYRVRKYIGAYLAVLGGAQAVVFGGGIGERSPEIRRRVCGPLAPIGLLLDEARNSALTSGEGSISADGSAIAAYVLATDEERIIARETFDLLSS